MQSKVTASGWVGLAIGGVLFLVLPILANSQWISIFTSTACFTLAAMGAGFMYSRLGMVSLAQI
jgi:branched-chain amino acid transport system permease protein